MARSIVDAGVCGFRSEIRVISLDGTAVQVTVLSRCPNVTRLAQELDDQTLDGFQEIMRRRRGGHECSPLQALFNQYIPHPGCPVYSGMVKAIEVALGTALPVEARIQVMKD